MSTRYKIDRVRPERVNSMRLHEASFRERLYDNLMQIVYEESILGKIFERLEAVAKLHRVRILYGLLGFCAYIILRFPVEASEAVLRTIIALGAFRCIELDAPRHCSPYWLKMALVYSLMTLLCKMFAYTFQIPEEYCQVGKSLFVVWACTAPYGNFERVYQGLLGSWYMMRVSV
ncbi:uncharacterized protein LOC111268496 [Varroa jacobsoni]|uniref:uncharacterized protein LOC111268496 n=1 Tax=Varroa jacobsoni TaxID=62625 RepID=UPI000BF95790|nr:uncharacterized protein LOC111268496 [Varroa jacobsoni]